MDDRRWERLGARRVTRRGFIGGSAAAAAAFLAACSRRIDTGVTPTGTATALETALSIYNWENYINPETLKRYKDEFDIEPTLDFYQSNEDLQAKIKAGATGYDVCAPSNYMVSLMAQEDETLLELDLDRIPNLANCNPKYLDAAFDPGNKFSVPKDTGTTGIGYRRDKVSEEITSWADFYRLAEKYSGKIAMIDSGPEVVGSALKMLGYSYNTTDDNELAEAEAEILKLKPHVVALDSAQYDVMLERGRAWIVLGWNGDVLVSAFNKPEAKISYVVPSEGTEVWIDNWCILKSAPHPNRAHQFINWILQPEIQGLETSYTYYASAVDAARQFVDEAVANDPAVYPPDDVISKLEVNDGNPDGQIKRNQIYERFKAA